MQRNPNPRGTIVQFINQLVKSLIENIDVQERVESLVLCGNNGGIPNRVSIGAQKLALNVSFPTARPRLELSKILRAP